MGWNLVSSHDSCRSLIFAFFSWVGFAFIFDGNAESMDGWTERREGWRFGFFWGVLFAGLLIQKYSSFTGEVSIGEKRLSFPPYCYAMRCHTLGFDEEAGERASPISS